MNRSPFRNASQIARFVSVLLLLGLLVVYLGSQKNFGPLQYAQLTLDGLRGGAIYALIAMGFVMVFNVTGVINFAQGAFVMLGAMLTVTFYHLEIPIPDGLHLLASAILAIFLTVLIGLLVERLTIYPARKSSTLTLIIITVGVYISLQGMALLAWGADAYVFPAFTTLEISDRVFRWVGLVIKAQSFWIWGIMLLVLAALMYFFERSLLGKAMRACSVNQLGARLVGINAEKMSLFAFGLAAAVGAIGGIVVAPILRPSYDMGLALGLKGFVAAILGGLVSTPGAVLGGLLLGLLENVAAGVTKAGMKDIYAFILLILTLLLRPQGLLGVRKTAVESSGEEH
ncbi:MAG: branched-chain amino acid ABC transporter permease [Anaerolineales bacterium]|jgi:branched-chain amino acid transport system permease protein